MQQDVMVRTKSWIKTGVERQQRLNVDVSSGSRVAVMRGRQLLVIGMNILEKGVDWVAVAMEAFRSVASQSRQAFG